MSEEMYKTRKSIFVTDSADDYVPTGKYDIYMNIASTEGIIDAKGTFIPLMFLQCFAITWECYNGK